ncbi:hypothetical protein C2G38_2234662 [Gigaspora rosea]|uniref:Ion transport domain-containing protein n=1 Tax=Gigaspora rosea TaxID=44941 RepID=A0A397TQS9_9GLOM|nr:hypothetical protein C2G38_2234662 [Gigaspora rosea]
MCKELSEINKESQACIDIQNSEFNVFINEKIYSMLDNSLRVQEISKSQWAKYLLEKFDYDKIRSLPSKSQIEKFLSNIIKTHVTEDGIIIREPKLSSECSYVGSLVKWNLKNGGKLLQALKLDENTEDWNSVDEWNIHPMHLKQSSKFIYRCELLGNEDLAMITSIGLLIWSIWKKDYCIRLRYYKGFPFQASYLFEKDYNNRFVSGTYQSKKFYERVKFVEFGAKKSDVEKLLEEMQECEKNSLPPPDFDAITQYYDELYMDQRRPLRELLDDYLDDKVIISLYGRELISSFLKNKDDQMMERLCKQCIKINIETEMEIEMETTEKETVKKTKKEAEKKTIDFLVNIKLLEIITYSFMSLTVKFPGLLEEYISLISLILTSTNKEIAVRNYSSKSHLQSLRVYSRPFNISLIKTFIYNFQKIAHKIINKSFDFLKKLHNIDIDEHPTVILIFPLPKFSSYPSKYNYWREIFFPDSSPFIKYTLDKYPGIYKSWIGQILIDFKWNTYGKYYFFAIWMFYFVFAGCFLVVATFENELSKSVQLHLLFATIILGILHFTFELRQCIHSPKHWIRDVWNYLDVGAILYPVLTSVIWLQTSTIPISGVTFSILLLELKFLLLFRNIGVIGVYYSLIFEVANMAISTFVITLGVIIFAFAHSLHVLLSNINKVSNDLNNSMNIASNSTSEKSLTTSSNMFTNLITAVFAVYMMLTGDSSYLPNWSLIENPTLAFLMIFFSFFTIIYLMNLFIGLLSNFIDETNKKEMFLLQRAKILAEIEHFYMLPYQRRKNNWFPELMFYKFNLDKLQTIIKKIQNDNWDETFEAPFISDALKKITKIYIETRKIDIDKIFEEFQRLKKIEEIIRLT